MVVRMHSIQSMPSVSLTMLTLDECVSTCQHQLQSRDCHSSSPCPDRRTGQQVSHWTAITSTHPCTAIRPSHINSSCWEFVRLQMRMRWDEMSDVKARVVLSPAGNLHVLRVYYHQATCNIGCCTLGRRFSVVVVSYGPSREPSCSTLSPVSTGQVYHLGM